MARKGEGRCSLGSGTIGGTVLCLPFLVVTCTGGTGRYKTRSVYMLLLVFVYMQRVSRRCSTIWYLGREDVLLEGGNRKRMRMARDGVESW